MDCPTLGVVPSFQKELLIKATGSGITILQKTRYRQRYTGSKYSQIDINGRLYLNGNDLKKAQKEERECNQKKKGPLSRRTPKNSVDTMQISNIFSTENTELSPIQPGLSPKSEKSRSYRINKKEVRQRLLGYLNTMKGKKELYFWTVTFPQGTPDDLCYRIFNIWLTSLRKYRMLKEYLWIAERQDGTRNDFQHSTDTLHFHIAIPHRMDVHRANSMMQGTLKTFSKRGEIPFTVYQCRRYNGVHISKNRKTGRVVNFAIKKGSRALSNYLTKYVTKNESEFSHLAWHNSRGYSSLFTGVTFTVEEFRSFGFSFFLNKTRVFQIGDFAKFIPWLDYPPPIFSGHLFQLNSYIQSQLN